MQGSAQTGDDPRIAPYQQIVLQPRPANDATGTQTFSMNKTYYLSLTIPKNQNYDLQYAIRLVKLPDSSSGDLDQMNYQFIRYITSRKVSDRDNDSSWVVLFQQKDIYYNPDDPEHDEEYFGDVMVEIPVEIEGEPQTIDNARVSDYVANTLYKYQDLYFWCTYDHQLWPTSQGNPISNIGKTDALLSHSWKMSQTDLTDTYNLIFKPRVADLNAIYLQLGIKGADLMTHVNAFEKQLNIINLKQYNVIN